MKGKNGHNHVAQPYCVHHKQQPWKIDRNLKWRNWYSLDRWCPFGRPPSLVRWLFLIPFAVGIVAVLICVVLYSVYNETSGRPPSDVYKHEETNAITPFLVSLPTIVPEQSNTKINALEGTVLSKARVSDDAIAQRGSSIRTSRPTCANTGQPEIRCPTGMSCQASSHTPSGVCCCAGVEPDVVSDTDNRALPTGPSLFSLCSGTFTLPEANPRDMAQSTRLHRTGVGFSSFPTLGKLFIGVCLAIAWIAILTYL
ncbi:hypothetical protein F5Y16DRAFT_418457 [Xylariaceae sp. FL0255]|nr:hypothetical protein F5Y16DRAFT_418457 [Xylariaceae sp. FL0255]